MKTEKEIKVAISKINANDELTYGYREDVTAVLNWVITGESLDGLRE